MPTAVNIRNALTALKWNYIGMAVRSGSGLLVGVVLARLLGPKPFGIVAIATLVIGLCNLLADFGFSSAVVQKSLLSEEDIRFSFTAQLVAACALAVMCIVLAPALAVAFRSQETIAVVRALALVFPLQALGQTSCSILRRNLQFRPIQTAQVASYLFGYLGLGIPLACLGFGVWALVVAQLGQAVVDSVLLFRAAPHSLSFSLRCRDRSAITSFGTKVICTNIVNWAILNLDNTFIGGTLGTVPLGLYSRAFNLAATPFAMVAGLQQVFFPATSRAQENTGALRQAYLGATALVAACMFPLFAIIGTAASTVTIGLYGSKWAGAAVLLRPLAFAIPLYLLVGIGGPLLWGMGKVQYELRAEAVTSVLAIVAYGVAARYSAVAVAWSVVLVYLVRLALVTRYVVHFLEVRWPELLGTLSGPLVLCTVAGFVTYVADSVLGRVGLSMPARLCGVAFVALLPVVTLVVMMPAMALNRAGIAALQAMEGSLPPSVTRFLSTMQPV